MSAPTRRQLTARGVKSVLTRAKVDHSSLTIADDPRVWRDVESGQQGTSVVITGPREARRQASEILYERGYGCAPYPDRDEWTRR